MRQDKKTTIAENADMPLGVKNYKLILLGIGIIIVGFFLMAGGGSSDPEHVFSYEMFSVRRIVIAPVVILAGLVLEIYAIMKK